MRLSMAMQIGSTILGRLVAGGSTLLNNLVSYWPLNEQSGTRYDAVGDNDLTDNNTVGAVNRGPVGTVASFVAANSESLTHAPLNAFSGDYTASMWVKSSLTAGTYYFFSAANGPYVYWTNSDNSFHVAHGSGNAAVQDVGFDRWRFVTISSDAGVLSIQIDDGTAGTAPTHTTPAETEFMLGGVSGTALFTGSLGPVAIWNRVLTAGERTSLFASGNGKRYADLTTAEKVGLVSYWNLDEASGTRVDSHGSNDLTDNNTVGSVINAGAAMDGSAASFVAANSENLTKSLVPSSGDLTMAFWMRPTATSANTGPMRCGDFRFDYDNYNNTIGFRRANSDFSYGGAWSSQVVTTGAWHLVVGTYDDATKEITITLDGTEVSASLVGKTPFGATGVDIGSGADASYYHGGEIDEVAIWSRVLTEDERTELYNAGQGRFYPFAS